MRSIVLVTFHVRFIIDAYTKTFRKNSSMRSALFSFYAASAILFPISHVFAHMVESDHRHHSGETIQLAENKEASEPKKTEANKLDGPQKSEGIKKLRVVGKFSLKGQLDNIDNRHLRARYVEIEPGGIVAVHRHGQNPGPAIAYLISGELTEFRQGEEPIVRKAGDAAEEYNGTVHWWRNDGSSIAKAVVVDIPVMESE